jgi:hypothetical protein
MGMRAAGVLLVAGIAVTACGDDDGGGESDGASAATTTVAVTVAAPQAASAETASGATTAPASSEITVLASVATEPPGTGLAANATAAATNGDAQCDVTITGAVTAQWSSDASG